MPFIPDAPSTTGTNKLSPGFVPDTQPENNSHGPVFNTLKGASDLAHSIGLGFIPDAAGTLLGIQNKLTTGNADMANNPYIDSNRAQKLATTNPFITSAKDAAGLTGWAMGGEGATLPLQLTKGFVSGSLIGASQDNATPGSVGASGVTNAALNVILPGIGNLAEKGLGRMSLGQGGEALPDLIQQSGNKIAGSGEELHKGLFDLTKPIRDKLSSILSNSEGKINPSEIFGATDEMGNKIKTGILDNLINKAGPSEQAGAKEYSQTLKNYFDDQVTNYFKNKGEPMPDLTDFINKDVSLPLDFWNEFMHGVGKDVGSAWDQQSSPTQKAMAKQLWGWLRSNISERSGNPEDINTLTKLSQSAMNITKNLDQKEKGNAAINLLKQLGIPVEIIGTLATGHPAAALAGAGGMLLKNPKVATEIINALENGGTEAISNVLGKLGGAGAANLIAPAR